MADNVQLPLFTGSAIFASDDIGGVQYPRGKQTWGADGVSNDTSHTAPLPVAGVPTHAAPMNAGGTARVTEVELAVSATADGDNTLLAAQGAGTQIRVINYFLNATGDGEFILKSGAVEKGYIRSAADADGGSFAGAVNSHAFTCATNTALLINCPANRDIKGHMLVHVIT